MGDQTHTTTPRIYVACLAAYNNGHLHGQWIDADQDEGDIFAEIHTMLLRSPVRGAEEYAIHDYEGFEGVRLEEYSAIGNVARIAAFLAEHGTLGGAVLAHFCGDLEQAAQAMEDAYLGAYASLADYVQDLTEETTQIPEPLRYYIDWQAMARDVEMNGDVFTIATTHDAVHVFAAR